jgi:shikimate kinase
MKKRGDAIVLIGFMGAGKSSVGRTLARMTGLGRFDTDEMIANRFGLSIAEIFEAHGEAKFREAETEALRELTGKGQAIIVTGGGIVLRQENVELLRELGTVFYLSADEDILFARISRRTTRPLLQTADPRATLRELLAARLPLYRSAAEVEVDTSRLKHEEVARKVLENLEDDDSGKVNSEG